MQFLSPITEKTGSWRGIILENLTYPQSLPRCRGKTGKVAPPPTRGRVACQAGRLSLFSAAQLSWEEAQSLMNGKLTRQGVHSGRELKPIRSKFFNRLAHSTWNGVLANITELLNSRNGTVFLSSGCLGTGKNARAAHTIRPLHYANKQPSLPGASGVESARDQPWAESPQPQARAICSTF